MTTIELIKKTYKILPPKQRGQLIFLAVLMLIMAFVEIALAGVISLLGVALSSPEALTTLPYVGEYFAKAPHYIDAPPVVAMLIVVLCLVVTATLAKNMMTAYITYKQGYISNTIAWAVGILIFKNYLYAPYMWYTQQNTGELQGYMGWRVYIANFWTGVLTTITQLCIILFLMVGAFITAPLVSLLLYGVCGTTAVLIYKFTQKSAKHLGEKISNMTIQSNKVTHFALQGMREVHIYNQRKPFQDQYASFAEPISLDTAKQTMFPNIPIWLLESVGFILLLCAVLLMQSRGDSVASITGTLTLMAGISWRLLPAMNKFVGGTLSIKSYFAPTSQLVRDYLQLPQEKTLPKYHDFHKDLTLKDIDFSYPKTDKKALNNININIAKGSMVGLVGLSGAGKSTLVGILTGLLPPSAGIFYIDGQEIMPKPGFLNIGYVPQSPYIMDATLAQNVAFSDWGKDVDEKRVLSCCKMAAMTFLEELPEGIHTMLGDRGIRLSGGQVQRVAIARALYNKPNILLFDEATSALDGAAESSIQKTILSLRQDMTIVIVAHRLTTVENCDKIYWMHEGEIKNIGGDVKALDEYKRFLDEVGVE